MAIEKRPSVRAKRGYVYRVRYPDPRSGRLLSATFEDERDASDFDGLWRVQRRKGALDQLDAGQQLLGDYTLEWLRAWKREKARKTQREIVRLIDRYILDVESDGNGGVEWSRDSIAWLQLRQVDPRVIEQWMFKLQDEGIGNESLRKTLYVLQQVFRRALAFRDYPHVNPVTLIDKPKAGERRRPVVFTPDVVEKLRAIFLKRGDLMSATLVSALAYSGCRPGEILAAQCKHVRDGRLLVEQRNSIGEIVAGAKSRARRVRTVPLPKVLLEDLEKWMTERGLSGDDPLFPNTRATYWTESDYRNWRRRHFQPAAKLAGFDGKCAWGAFTRSRRRMC